MGLTLFQMTNILHKHLYRDCPVDTENLHDRGLVKKQFGPNSMGVEMGGPLAPYGPITTLPWVSPHWNGKRNPHEGWAKRAANAAAEEIASTTGGRVA
ncbi:hypothetical protein KHQ81_12850 [Mycoplasmatota bacterium]|nr:hypothetical protein KHQ81_12850 [Mycoplasmatota bacterium]